MINLGIIGFGRMGEIHAGWITKNKDLNLLAVSKKVKDRTEEINKRFGVRCILTMTSF